MTVAIILFTQLQGAICYPSDTDTFILLFHRVIKPSDLFVPWACGAGWRRINASCFIISLSRSPPLHALIFPGNIPCLIKRETKLQWCCSGGRCILGRPWRGRSSRSDGAYSVHVRRLNTFQCLPTLMDENITTCRRTDHISEKKLWIWQLILRLEGKRLELHSVGRLKCTNVWVQFTLGEGFSAFPLTEHTVISSVRAGCCFLFYLRAYKIIGPFNFCFFSSVLWQETVMMVFMIKFSEVYAWNKETFSKNRFKILCDLLLR